MPAKEFHFKTARLVNSGLGIDIKGKTIEKDSVKLVTFELPEMNGVQLQLK
jgi:hypothetical protein